MKKLIECPVSIDPQHLLGSYTNAFRILYGAEDECFLDFLLYSEVEDLAVLVTRVRVHAEMLPEIQGNLGEVLTNLTEECPLGIATENGLLN